MNQQDIALCNIYTPRYVISIDRCGEKYPWYSWFKNNNIQGITYAFLYKNIPLKYGYSFSKYQSRSNKNTSYCERFTRQFNNLPGRSKVNKSDVYIKNYGFVPISKNGNDIIKNIQNLEKELNVKINRQDLYAHIWDISNLQSTQYFWLNDDHGNTQRAKYFESLLVEQYKRDNNGKLPIGNRKQDPTLWNTAFTQPKISIEASKLFDF